MAADGSVTVTQKDIHHQGNRHTIIGRHCLPAEGNDTKQTPAFPFCCIIEINDFFSKIWKKPICFLNFPIVS